MWQRVIDENAMVRLAAVRGCRQISSPNFDPRRSKTLLRLMLPEETDPAVREEILLAMGELRAVQSAPIIASILTDAGCEHVYGFCLAREV